MGRVFRKVEVDGKRFWALFESGAENTYVVPAVGGLIPRQALRTPRISRLGGQEHEIREVGILVGSVEGYSIDGDAQVIDEIGADKKGRAIEILVGSFLMQKWGILLDLKNERLDFTHYPKEFVEF